MIGSTRSIRPSGHFDSQFGLLSLRFSVYIPMHRTLTPAGCATALCEISRSNYSWEDRHGAPRTTIE
jgi:hypothetical protein